MSLRSTPAGRLSASWPAPAGGLRTPPPELIWVGGATAASLAIGAAIGKGMVSPLPIAALIGAAALWLALGPESVAAMALLAALGFLPFVDPETIVAGGQTIWTVGFVAAAAIVFLAWAARQTRGEPTRFEGSWLLALVGVLLVYGWTRLALSAPLAEPSTTARLAIFAPAALLAYVVFSQPKAVANLRRALPLIVAILALWAVAYILASTGQCASCVDVVQSTSERPGLSGGESRLYTAGQESFNGFVLIAFGAALAFPSPLTIGLAALGFLNVATQATRAQYLAVTIGALALLVWKFPRLRPSGRIGMTLGIAVATIALAISPVGQRAFSGYEELTQSSGNAGYRLQLLHEASGSWDLFGVGVRERKGDVNFNFDLGLPNTLLGFGYVGAALQLLVLVAAAVRAFRYGGALGASLGAVAVYVIAARPSLPLLEYGPSAIFYGLIVGAICALPLARRYEEHLDDEGEDEDEDDELYAEPRYA